MSARELTISDLPKIGSYVTVHPKEDWGPGLVTHSKLHFLEVVWDCGEGEASMSWSGKNVKTGLSFIKPSAKPHVAAGPAWTMKLRDAVMELLDAATPEPGVPYMPSKAFAKLTCIHELLDEVCELPAPSKFIVTVTIDENGYECAEIADAVFPKHPVMRVLKNQATDLAAALIRAATSSDPSA